MAKNYKELREKIQNRTRTERVYWKIKKTFNRFSFSYNWTLLKYFLQKRIRGFSDEELWSLDITIIKFIYPRLKRFRDLGPHSFPSELNSYQEWQDILDKMVNAFEIIIEDINEDRLFLFLSSDIVQQEKIQTVEEGLELFHKWFFALWD